MGSQCCKNSQPDITVKEPAWAKAVTSGHIESMRNILNNKPEIINEYINNHGICAIHHAVQTKNTRMLEYLLENGVNMNKQRSKDGNTALHIASIARNVNIIRLLFEYRVNDTIVNHKKKTAYDVCTLSFKRTYKKLQHIKLMKMPCIWICTQNISQYNMHMRLYYILTYKIVQVLVKERRIL